MSVIIMYPKHNLEMKYKSGEGGHILFLSSCCKAEYEIPDHDVMKMYFLWENINFTLSSKDLNVGLIAFIHKYDIMAQ